MIIILKEKVRKAEMSLHLLWGIFKHGCSESTHTNLSSLMLFPFSTDPLVAEMAHDFLNNSSPAKFCLLGLKLNFKGDI